MVGQARSHGSGSLPVAEINALFMAAAGGWWEAELDSAGESLRVGSFGAHEGQRQT
jgi:hypothetical protein